MPCDRRNFTVPLKSLFMSSWIIGTVLAAFLLSPTGSHAQSLANVSPSDLSLIVIERDAIKNDRLVFVKSSPNRWLSIDPGFLSPNTQHKAITYDVLSQTNYEIKLYSSLCNLHVSIFPNQTDASAPNGLVSHALPGQNHRLLGNIASQHGTSAQEHRTAQNLVRQFSISENAALVCPHQTGNQASSNSSGNRTTTCSPFLWMGAPWETNYGAIFGAVVIPDASSLEQYRFMAVYDGEKTLNGTIHIHSPCSISGVWQHPTGASGRFHFKLLHNNAFSGVWTNGAADPLSGAQADNWFGSR